MKRDPALLALLGGWLLFAVACVWLRPLWPVDETRYASVAWEMWIRGDFLVPYINGEPYSHKPPLLFWLIHAGWALFGVNEWWPRMVAPLAALAAVPLLLRLQKLLWGDEEGGDHNAVWVLFGTLLFATFVTLTMFDLLLLLCALIGMIGVVLLSQGKRKGLLWLGAGIGLGVLVKGPVILLHILPAAVVAPWWAPEVKARLRRYYADLLLGVLAGAAIGLAWALPAGYFGGVAYRDAIFFGQTAGRVSESFAHRAPWWYYLPLLPVILFPYLVWPRVWVGLRKMFREEGKDPGSRFLAAWLLLTLVGFSLVSGKQAKYLVPFLPAFALLAGRALGRVRDESRVQDARRRWEFLLPALCFAAFPAALAWLRLRPDALKLPDWVGDVPTWPIVLLAAGVLALLACYRAQAATQMRALAFATLAAFCVIGAGVVPAFVPYADPAPPARALAALQARELPVGHLGKYHAQYNFIGRLRQPLEILDDGEARGWITAHPEARVLTVERTRYPDGKVMPEQQWRYRGAWLQLWRGDALLVARPELR